MEIYYGREKVLMQAGMHRYNHFGDWKYSCNDAELSQSSRYCFFVLSRDVHSAGKRIVERFQKCKYQIKLSLISFCRNYISD